MFNYIKRIPFEVKYILLLFIVTRVILTVIGITSRILISHSTFVYPFGLDIWCVWDCGWYQNIALEGYSAAPPDTNQQNYNFFPLYPLLMAAIGKITGDVVIAGVILSNVFLLAACFFMYKLVKLDENDTTALNSVKYLLLFPTAFIFSGVFTESLFIALTLACFYYARKSKWFIASMLGSLTCLTRSIGILIIIPLFYEYLKERNFYFKKIRWNILFLLLIPVGALVWCAYNYHITKDAFAFLHASKVWGVGFKNPLQVIEQIFSISTSMITFIQGILPVVLLFVITLFYRQIRLSYWISGIYTILVPLTFGSMYSMPRYVLLSFPIYIIFAKMAQNKNIDLCLMITMSMLQGFLMVFWTASFMLVV